MGEAQHLGDGQGYVHGVDDPAPDGVVNVVVDVGDLVGQPEELAFQGLRPVGAGVAEDAPPHLIGQVEALPLLFQPVHHPQGLLVVGEAAGQDFIEHPLPGVAEGGVAQIVAVGRRLRQILVEPQAPGNGAGDAADLDGVGHAGAVVVPLRLQKDLGLVLEPPEGLGVDDPVDVPLEAGAGGTGLQRRLPPPGLGRQACKGGEHLPLQRLGLFAQGHRYHLPLSSLCNYILLSSEKSFFFAKDS